MTNPIAIIGGGISGTLTVLQCIKQSIKPLSIIWFDSQNKYCRGYAYNTFDYNHLLNVRANNMSVFADNKNHFVDWLKQNYSHYSSNDFVPRKIYGDYIEHIFESLKKSNPLVDIIKVSEEVTSINKINSTFEIKTDKIVEVKKVVLALGNFLPAHPHSISQEFMLSVNYFQNAFDIQLTNQIQQKQDITIIGSGLTMIDVVVSLAKYNYKGMIRVISPHAYIPQAHEENPLPSIAPFIDTTKKYSLIELVSLVNKKLKIAKKEQLSLHSVIDGMRPYLQSLWLNFSTEEKRQFLRHLRHKWGVARHRAPLQSIEIFNRLKLTQQLVLRKGRIYDIKVTLSGFEILYRNVQNISKNIETELIINCTGPESDYTKLKSTLIQQLIKNSIIEPDDIHYGLKSSKDGYLSQNLYTIGPPLKGTLWESMAVPEIRLQAQELAAKIICD